jgi:hypothetical protein
VACEAFPDGVPGQRIANGFDEGMPVRITSILLRGSQNHDDNSETRNVYNDWYKLVQKYSLCRLTYATDLFPALSGLAKAFANLLKDEYIAGLWRNDLLNGLLWSSYHDANRNVTFGSRDYLGEDICLLVTTISLT